MAERKAQPAAKKAAVTKVTVGKPVTKPKTTRAAPAATPKKAAVKKVATAATKAKPKSTSSAVAKKAVAPAVKKTAPVKNAAATKTGAATKRTMTRPAPEERYRMVQTAAYFIAERNGFGGNSIDHWAAAEVEIAGMLGK